MLIVVADDDDGPTCAAKFFQVDALVKILHKSTLLSARRVYELLLLLLLLLWLGGTGGELIVLVMRRAEGVWDEDNKYFKEGREVTEAMPGVHSETDSSK
jgi:hypothetical protein